jgi:hypothetical protein
MQPSKEFVTKIPRAIGLGLIIHFGLASYEAPPPAKPKPAAIEVSLPPSFEFNYQDAER